MITDKLVAKIPSAYAGKVTKLNFKNDEICQVGQPLLEMEVGDDVEVKEEAASSEHKEEPAAEAPKAEPPKAEAPKPEPKHEAPPSGKVLATPAVRGLAVEMKVDLTKVTPTGKGGRITKNDVLKYAEGMKAAPSKEQSKEMPKDTKKTDQYVAPPIPVPLEHDAVKKLTGIHRAMVKSMTDALSIPAYNIQEQVCTEQVKRLRSEFLKNNPNKKITYLPFFMKAFSQAMLEYPIFNAVSNPNVDSEGCIYEYIEKAEHNISIAIDSPSGLVVPNVKSVQRKSILKINEELRAVISRGRKGTLTHDDLNDGTFTISSISGIGSRVGTPVIFRPQVAIAAMCRVSNTPEFIKKPNGDYEIKPVEAMQLSLTCDHRIIDTITAAKFITAVKKCVEDIESLLLTLK